MERRLFKLMHWFPIQFLVASFLCLTLTRCAVRTEEAGVDQTNNIFTEQPAPEMRGGAGTVSLKGGEGT